MDPSYTEKLLGIFREHYGTPLFVSREEFDVGKINALLNAAEHPVIVADVGWENHISICKIQSTDRYRLIVGFKHGFLALIRKD